LRPVHNIVNGIDLRSHGGLIATLANRYRRFVGGCLEWDDLMQAGWLGLHKAAVKFDHGRGVKFSTYAGFWIRAFIQRMILNDRRTVRVPVHRQHAARGTGERLPLDALSLNVPLDPSNPESEWIDLLRADSDPEREAVDNDFTSQIEAAVDALPEMNRRAIRGRFWGEYTLREIGDDAGLSRERIRQREAQALDRLERPLSKLRDDV
jgi:RNA polymerase sigma factor (sigma-70 family)